MPYTYVRFTNRNDDSTGKSQYTVDLPSPIENAVSVHVKSFSMPNTAYNVTSENNTFHWYEYDATGGGNPVLLSATLPDIKFYSIGELVTDMAAAMTSASLAAGTNFTYTITQIASSVTVDTYHINVNVVSTDNNDKWCPLVHKQSLWDMLGFRVIFTTAADHRGRVTPSLNHITNEITSGADTRLLATSTGAGTDHVSEFPPRDSHESYHITCSLANSVYEIEAGAQPRHTNYLLTIPNNSNRYSWLQYVPTEPVFHNLKGATINQFTIGLADEHGLLMNNNEHQSFSVVLAFEYRDLHATLEANQLRTLEWRRSHC